MTMEEIEEYLNADRLYENVPAWSKTVPPCKKVLSIPHEDGEKLESFDDLRVSKQLAEKNILCWLRRTFFVGSRIFILCNSRLCENHAVLDQISTLIADFSVWVASPAATAALTNFVHRGPCPSTDAFQMHTMRANVIFTRAQTPLHLKIISSAELSTPS